MPNYDYECKKCGKTFEISHSITAKPIKKCIHCGGGVKRLIGGGGGFILKGSGFYATDHRSSSYKDAAKKDSSAPAGGCGDKKECSGCPVNKKGK
ncbi:MAG: hypothetical protein AUJ75_04420 [Candidatus Omnitrophica bacterium CG1_02_49_10]|nr:MAG: hypothetical protein AUJ75_04420 [Candidatus Omnitrophica bacterium CG1_02_49_10]